MSGHSKWHNIQGRKGKQDAVRSNMFTKFAKTITIAAARGGDPETNFSLRLAIDKAKAGGMPKDNIDRAIKRGTGELKGELTMEELLYEGFGPGGVGVLVKVVTDNKNRTLGEIKNILSRYGGSLGSAGSVQWMFEQWGIVTIALAQAKQREEFELALIEAGAEDIKDLENQIEIKVKVPNFQKVLARLAELGIAPAEQGIRFVAKEPVAINDATGEKLGELFSELDNHDDVEDYYTNAA